MARPQRDELQRLRDRVAELEGLLGIADGFELQRLGLSPTESMVCGMLLKRAVVSHEAIFTALYGDRSECDQPNFNMVTTLISLLRRRLKVFNVGIRNERSRGYYILESHKALLRAALAKTS